MVEKKHLEGTLSSVQGRRIPQRDSSSQLSAGGATAIDFFLEVLEGLMKEVRLVSRSADWLVRLVTGDEGGGMRRCRRSRGWWSTLSVAVVDTHDGRVDFVGWN